MRRLTALAASACLLLGIAVLTAPAAQAGKAHFIKNAFEVSRSGDSLTVSGKEAGLGNLDQVHIVVEATAACVNPGGNRPQAANKQTVAAGDDFPVQNGKADFTLTVTADFQPRCSPPMSVVFSDITVTDTTNGVTARLRGVF
ncbi:MAG: hypothetical protein GEU97_24225 [Actinophytocola sp.]|nr:hypothetical protein [Actinophytocola sp.]